MEDVRTFVLILQEVTNVHVKMDINFTPISIHAMVWFIYSAQFIVVFYYTNVSVVV